MRFDERFLDEIKSRLRLSDVIGRTVKLRRQGREFAGLSPFTKEKTPSFYVNDEKGFYHCFSSGKHGDLISFVQETERLSFPEAIERLAAEAGVPMPAQDARQAEQDQKRATLTDWLEAAAAWFEGELRRPTGNAARAYLENRGLPEAEWKRFRLGYAPAGRTSLKDYLVQKGARPADLVQAGLLIAPEDGGAAYDRFRNRIIFPITDVRGRVISFGGRALDPEARAKYLNGPETEIFSKGQILYGIPEARKLLATNDVDPPLVVVEGYMDVIACQRANIAAVAPLGTALTEEQMALLWRFHPEPTLCFDGDAAGQRAAARSVERALPEILPEKSLRFAIVSGGKDPDDVLRDQGAPALRAQLSKTVPFAQFLFEKELNAQAVDTPERRAGLKIRLRQAAASIKNKDLSEQYRNTLIALFDERFPRTKFVPGWGVRNENLHILLVKDAAARLKERARLLNASIAVRGIQSPEWMLPYVEEIAAFGFGDEKLEILKKPIIDALYNEVHTREGVEAIIRGSGVSTFRAYESAVRIALTNVPPLAFFDSYTDKEKQKLLWRSAMDAVMNLAAVKLAIEDKNPRDEDPNEYVEQRRILRRRKLLLQVQLSSLSFWDAAPPSPN